MTFHDLPTVLLIPLLALTACDDPYHSPNQELLADEDDEGDDDGLRPRVRPGRSGLVPLIERQRRLRSEGNHP